MTFEGLTRFFLGFDFDFGFDFGGGGGGDADEAEEYEEGVGLGWRENKESALSESSNEDVELDFVFERLGDVEVEGGVVVQRLRPRARRGCWAVLCWEHVEVLWSWGVYERKRQREDG